MPDPGTPYLFIVFIAMWCAISSLLSVMGGWFTLSRKFHDHGSPQGKRFFFSSMGAGLRWFPVNYGGCIIAYLGKGGLRLSVWPIFRIMHPPLLIPWNEITSVTSSKMFFSTLYTVNIGRTKTNLYFRGKLGESIYTAWKTMNENS